MASLLAIRSLDFVKMKNKISIELIQYSNFCMKTALEERAMTVRRQALGRRGEEEVVRYLTGQGYRLVKRNFCCPAGEIDIIAMDGKTLVFVEVRSRSSENFGLPQESVNWRKQAKLRLVARHYLAIIGGYRGQVRFDVLALKYGSRGRLEHLKHIQNAF